MVNIITGKTDNCKMDDVDFQLWLVYLKTHPIIKEAITYYIDEED